MNTKHSAKTKLLAQASGIIAAAVVGVLASSGTAVADGHNVLNPDGTWGSQDGAEKRGWDLLPAVHFVDASEAVFPSNPASPSNLPESTYPKESTWPMIPPSWPGNGFGSVAG